ncbi:cupredoxin domain-containing protein [Allosalinactinospora lopnorensis]|uniref:plastocyanin/azurin family copper-binding protein n=1 Tax=Allosalinactinospora lopnorensis TaxID=1352348 RepID=UPI000623BD31|nr:plastocyanin/azurin family copper-binding protein [Allosalinactinospora lopnorensis]
MSRLVLVALTCAGVLGLAACGQDEASTESSEPAEEGQVEVPVEDEGPAEENDEAVGTADETISVEAGDNYFEGIPDTLPAGTTEIQFENVGDAQHDIVIGELGTLQVVASEGGRLQVVVSDGGGSDSGLVELEPGEYLFYCSIPGHRPDMEKTVTVA